jgi:hypothetical protein
MPLSQSAHHLSWRSERLVIPQRQPTSGDGLYRSLWKFGRTILNS